MAVTDNIKDYFTDLKTALNTDAKLYPYQFPDYIYKIINPNNTAFSYNLNNESTLPKILSCISQAINSNASTYTKINAQDFKPIIMSMPLKIKGTVYNINNQYAINLNIKNNTSSNEIITIEPNTSKEIEVYFNTEIIITTFQNDYSFYLDGQCTGIKETTYGFICTDNNFVCTVNIRYGTRIGINVNKELRKQLSFTVFDGYEESKTINSMFGNLDDTYFLMHSEYSQLYIDRIYDNNDIPWIETLCTVQSDNNTAISVDNNTYSVYDIGYQTGYPVYTRLISDSITQNTEFTITPLQGTCVLTIDDVNEKRGTYYDIYVNNNKITDSTVEINRGDTVSIRTLQNVDLTSLEISHSDTLKLISMTKSEIADMNIWYYNTQNYIITNDAILNIQ